MRGNYASEVVYLLCTIVFEIHNPHHCSLNKYIPLNQKLNVYVYIQWKEKVCEFHSFLN